MLVFLTHRRLKGGSFEEFRRAWEPEEMPEWIREVAYHARSLEDPDEIVSFGLAYDMEPGDLARLREEFSEGDDERQRRLAEFVEWTGVDGVFEVVDEVRWGM
ncbi:MAG: hypothetical protein M3N24_04205 [Actinomycetota bacterium]|nr:hypothetical protein [Actinomycetota bacterium]